MTAIKPAIKVSVAYIIVIFLKSVWRRVPRGRYLMTGTRIAVSGGTGFGVFAFVLTQPFR